LGARGNPKHTGREMGCGTTGSSEPHNALRINRTAKPMYSYVGGLKFSDRKRPSS